MSSISQKRRQAPSPSLVPTTQPLVVQSAPDMLRTKQHEPNPRKSHTSPNTGARQPSQGRFAQQPPQPRAFDHKYRRTSYDPYTPSCPTSADLTPPTPSGPGMPPHAQPDISDLTSHGVPDLSAMMFPTSDPFAYPKQPMTTLENQNYIKQENIGDVYSPVTTTAPPYQNFEAHFGLQNYILPSSQPQPSWGMQNMNEASIPITRSEDLAGMSAPWPLQQQPQQQQNNARAVPPQGNYDQIFGEDWGGWMSQGYRQ